MRKVKWSNIGLLISIIFILYIVLSFIDTNIHNDVCSKNFLQYSSWNLFNILF